MRHGLGCNWKVVFFSQLNQPSKAIGLTAEHPAFPARHSGLRSADLFSDLHLG